MIERNRTDASRQICILTEMYYPEEASTGYLLTKTAEGLTDNFHVDIITGPATHFHLKKDVLNFEIHNRVKIYRCHGTSFDKDSLIGRIVNLLTRSATIFLKALQKCKTGGIVFVVTNPPTLPLVALFVALIKRCKFVLLVHDVYPEVLIASGFAKPDAFAIRLSSFINKIIYNRCDRIVTLGRDMSQLVRRKLNSSRYNSIVCIPNWAEHDVVRPTARDNNSLLNQLGLQGKFIVLYAGNLGRTHGIEYLASAALQLHNEAVHFVVLGFGAKKKWLERFVKDNALSNVTILDPRPRSEQITFLNACDSALISFVPGMAGVSVPSRMYNQMAAGKPIIAIADSESELAQVIQEEKIGWVIQPGDITGLVQTIKWAAAHHLICMEFGERAFQVSCDKYSLSQANAKYATLFENLAK